MRRRLNWELIAAGLYLAAAACMIVSFIVPSPPTVDLDHVRKELGRVGTDYERQELLVKERCVVDRWHAEHDEPLSSDAADAVAALERLNQDLLRYSTDGTLSWESRPLTLAEQC